MKRILATSTMFLVLLVLSGCGLFGRYEIVLLDEASEVYETFEGVRRNQTITLPDLEKDGYIFVGWESDDTVYQRLISVQEDLKLTPVFEKADEVFELNVYGDDTAGIIGYTGTARYLKIPYEINGHMISRIEFLAFEESNIIEVLIPNSVTSVQSAAFKDALDLEVVEFYGDYVGYTPRMIPADKYYEMIEEYGCIVVDDSYTPTEKTPWVFEDGCAIVEVYNITESVIGPGGKEYYSYEVLISNAIDSSGVMQLIHLPAFEGAENIRRIVLPKQLRYIDQVTFGMLKHLEELIVHEDSPYMKSIDGVVYSDDLTELLFYPGGLKAKTFTVPEAVTSIDFYAFGDGFNLEKIIIPCSLENVYGYSFAYASSIKSFEVCGDHESLYTVSGVLFTNQPEVTLVAYPRSKNGNHYNVPADTIIIGEGAFARQSNLQTITFPEGLERITYFAFGEFETISVIDLPSSIRSIEHSAFFSRTHRLETLIIRRSIEDGALPYIAPNISNNPDLVIYVPDNSIQAYVEQNTLPYPPGVFKRLSELDS